MIFKNNKHLTMPRGGVIFIFYSVIVLCLVDYAKATAYGEACCTDPTKKLKLVHIVFRHGIRTPASTYPNDPYINETFYPFGWGEITNDGKQNLYETGEWLNKRYGQFLGKYYMPKTVWAQSTGISRTKMSLEVLLAGLYPPKGTPMEWNRKLNWQPIPIFAQPLVEDNLLLVNIPCPRYQEELEEVFETPELRTVINNCTPLYDKLTNITGMVIRNPNDVQSLFSTLQAESEYGLKLPKWTRKYYPNPLKKLTELSYIYNVYNDELKSLKAGPFLAKMINEWQEKRENSDDEKNLRKIYLYCGHDSTMVNILDAIGVWKLQLPIFGIMAIFELLQDTETNEYGVQIYLRRDAASGVKPLVVPGCQHFCPLNKFIELTRNVVPTNFTAACIPKNKNFVPPPASSSGP